MGNREGTSEEKMRRWKEIIALYDRGHDAEDLAALYHLSQRRIYQVVSESNRVALAAGSFKLA